MIEILLFFSCLPYGGYTFLAVKRVVIVVVGPNTGLESPGESSEIRGRKRNVGIQVYEKDLEIETTWGTQLLTLPFLL